MPIKSYYLKINNYIFTLKIMKLKNKSYTGNIMIFIKYKHFKRNFALLCTHSRQNVLNIPHKLRGSLQSTVMVVYNFKPTHRYIIQK